MAENEVIASGDVWDELDLKEDVQEQQFNITRNESFSAGIRKMLQRPASDDVLPVNDTKDCEILPQFDSIFEIARRENMTVAEFVQRDPQYALRITENCYANWQKPVD